MTERWRIEVDRGSCVGAGGCVASAPHAFTLDGSFRSAPRCAELEADPSVLQAAEACPVEAIAVVGASSGRQVYPQD